MVKLNTELYFLNRKVLQERGGGGGGGGGGKWWFIIVDYYMFICSATYHAPTVYSSLFEVR